MLSNDQFHQVRGRWESQIRGNGELLKSHAYRNIDIKGSYLPPCEVTGMSL